MSVVASDSTDDGEEKDGQGIKTTGFDVDDMLKHRRNSGTLNVLEF